MRSTAAQGDEDHAAGEHVDEVSESEDCEAGKKPQAGRRFRIVPEPELEDGSGQFRNRKFGKSGNLGMPEIPEIRKFRIWSVTFWKAADSNFWTRVGSGAQKTP